MLEAFLTAIVAGDRKNSKTFFLFRITNLVRRFFLNCRFCVFTDLWDQCYKTFVPMYLITVKVNYY